MTELVRNTIDKDLLVLDELIGECTIPNRDWTSIINLYEINNKPFPIPAVICSKIIQRVKLGNIPKMVFKEYGINHNSFLSKYNKIKTLIEEISMLKEITVDQSYIIESCKSDPIFLLGSDLERASAFHFNNSLGQLEEISKLNPQAWKEYMKVVHSEEFSEKEKDKEISVVIKVAPNLIDKI